MMMFSKKTQSSGVSALTKYIRTLLFLSLICGVPLCKADSAQNCTLPPQYKVPAKTFIINPSLSCSTNVFIHAVPSIAGAAEQKLTPEQKKDNPQAVGRLAYELLGNEFAKNKPNVPVSDLKIPGKEGKHEIPVRLYSGTNKEKFILFVHGGGWTRGNLETHDTLCRKLCEATQATVLAVDYRLAPENPHPAGLEDAETAYDWFIAQHAHDKKVYVAGDSGGGNIVTSLMIKLIKEDKRIPSGAILIYPALDLHIPETTTNPYATGYFLTRDSINTYVNNYTGHNEEKANDPTVSPVMASDQDLSKFPPVILVNAQCDPLAAEGKSFADRLISLGVSVNHKIVPNTIHVFAQYFDQFPEATEALNFIKENFEKIK